MNQYDNNTKLEKIMNDNGGEPIIITIKNPSQFDVKIGNKNSITIDENILDFNTEPGSNDMDTLKSKLINENIVGGKNKRRFNSKNKKTCQKRDKLGRFIKTKTRKSSGGLVKLI